jgi:hypothetical protein
MAIPSKRNALFIPVPKLWESPLRPRNQPSCRTCAGDHCLNCRAAGCRFSKAPEYLCVDFHRANFQMQNSGTRRDRTVCW